MDQTLGLLGHPGGILVDHPRLRIGVVAAISRPEGLALELVARSPFRHAARPAPRVLLPRYDEGLNLRVAWLDAEGRPHWEYGSVDTGTGTGTVLRTRLGLPPMYDSTRLVLAWPEIAFPEAVVTVPLPGRDAVRRAATSIWTAPVDNEPAGPARITTPRPSLDVHPEAGLVLSGPRVLHRGGDAVVVLTRLTLVGPALSIEIESFARGRHGGVATMSSMYGPGPHAGGAGASVALLSGDELSPLAPVGATAAGGDDVFHGRADYAFERPESAFLRLVVGWPDAGLPDVVVRLPLDS